MFYHFRKFLDEYYPISDFVEVKLKEVRLGDRIGRPVAVMIKYVNKTIPLPLKAPRQAIPISPSLRVVLSSHSIS